MSVQVSPVNAQVVVQTNPCQVDIDTQPVAVTVIYPPPPQITVEVGLASFEVSVGYQGVPGRDGADGTDGQDGRDGTGVSYRLEFTDASLTVADLLPVNHGLGYRPTGITVWDGDGEVIDPDEITHQDNLNLGVLLASYRPLQGTWAIAIGA